MRQYSVGDYILTAVTFIAYSVPAFWLADVDYRFFREARLAADVGYRQCRAPAWKLGGDRLTG